MAINRGVSSGEASFEAPLTFTIQEHVARRLHYDFRLEIDGVLVSWPIPRGPAYDPRERRLAVQVEDHALEHGTFEGGRVIVWDAGTYTVVSQNAPLDFHARARVEPLAREGVAGGHLSMFLNGRKLKGGWTLLRTRGQGPRSQWLFLKRRDGLERPGIDITQEDRSVISGLSIADLERGLLPEWRASQLAPTAEHVVGARRRGMLASDELPSGGDTRVVAVLDRGHVTFTGTHRDELDGDISRSLAAQPVDQAVLIGLLEATVSGQQFRALDLLYLDGYDLRAAAPAERHPLLHAALAPLDGVEVALR
jgi:DNA ligase D-like protein (predicted 3'-phosphoesterase)